jgi:hypothetical protein
MMMMMHKHAELNECWHSLSWRWFLIALVKVFFSPDDDDDEGVEGIFKIKSSSKETSLKMYLSQRLFRDINRRFIFTTERIFLINSLIIATEFSSSLSLPCSERESSYEYLIPH